MYYILYRENFEAKNYYYLNGTLYDNEQNVVEPIFDDGVVHANMNDPYTLILDESKSLIKKRARSERVYSDRIVSFVIDAGSLFLISPRVQELFSKLILDDIQMYSVSVKGSNFELSDYKIVKVLHKVDCVDLEKSELDYREKYKKIKRAQSLVLKKEKIPQGIQIFLLGKRTTGTIIVHEDLKNAMEEENLTGFTFHSLDEAHKVM